MSSQTISLGAHILSGRSDRASIITFSVLARKSESGATSCLVLSGFSFFYPAAFEVLERNLLVLTGPRELVQSLGRRPVFDGARECDRQKRPPMSSQTLSLGASVRPV